ncbi:MAG: hypothetical protein QW261_16770 [Candidatus Jordarchaeaceae archaeon]
MVKKSEKNSGKQRVMFNKVSLLLILNWTALVALSLSTLLIFKRLSETYFFLPIRLLACFPFQELTMLRLMFVLVTVPLPFLLFYTPIYNGVSNRHKGYREVWSLIKRVVKQNYRRNAMFLLAPALSIVISVLWGAYGFMSTLSWAYTLHGPGIIPLFILLMLMFVPFSKALSTIIQEIKNIP